MIGAAFPVGREPAASLVLQSTAFRKNVRDVLQIRSAGFLEREDHVGPIRCSGLSRLVQPQGALHRDD
jgi:hypothetical protein